MNQGWISVHRKMLDNPIVFKDADHVAVWIYLLLNATHKEQLTVFKGEKIMLKPGQLITGRKAISDFLKINESKVKRILSDFENDQQIDRQRSNKNSLISLLNWNKYQNVGQQSDQPATSKVTSKHAEYSSKCDQQNNIEKSADIRRFSDYDSQPVTSQRPAKDKNVTSKVTTNNKTNNEKNNETSNVVCPEQALDPSGILLPLVDKSFYDVPLHLLEQWRTAYPAISIEIELQKMVSWLNANPARRKTRKGIERFIVSWLARSQDNEGMYRRQPPKQTGFSNFEQRDYDFDELERQLLAAQDH